MKMLLAVNPMPRPKEQNIVWTLVQQQRDVSLTILTRVASGLPEAIMQVQPDLE